MENKLWEIARRVEDVQFKVENYRDMMTILVVASTEGEAAVCEESGSFASVMSDLLGAVAAELKAIGDNAMENLQSAKGGAA